jgi:hypothetical protein
MAETSCCGSVTIVVVVRNFICRPRSAMRREEYVVYICQRGRQQSAVIPTELISEQTGMTYHPAQTIRQCPDCPNSLIDAFCLSEFPFIPPRQVCNLHGIIRHDLFEDSWKQVGSISKRHTPRRASVGEKVRLTQLSLQSSRITLNLWPKDHKSQIDGENDYRGYPGYEIESHRSQAQAMLHLAVSKWCEMPRKCTRTSR